MNIFFVTALVVMICGFILLVGRKYIALRRETEGVPTYLANGLLRYSERRFTGPMHLPIVARVDRAYEVRDQLHLVEFKTRRHARVYESDIIELSAQRVAVAFSTGEEVSLKGTVLTEDRNSGRRVAHSVTLYSEERIAQLMHRRRSILNGSAAPTDTTVRGRCTRCEYRDECKGIRGARIIPLFREVSFRSRGKDSG